MLEELKGEKERLLKKMSERLSEVVCGRRKYKEVWDTL